MEYMEAVVIGARGAACPASVPRMGKGEHKQIGPWSTHHLFEDVRLAFYSVRINTQHPALFRKQVRVQYLH